MKITFDSNVWRKVSSPESFPRDADISRFRAINTLIRSGGILGCLSETIFRVEGMTRAIRQQFIGNYTAGVEKSVAVLEDGTIHVRMTFGPNTDKPVEASDYHRKHLGHAREIGMKLLYCPRMGNQVNPDILDSDYLALDPTELDKVIHTFCEVAGEIEARGCGMTWLTEIGRRYSEDWRQGIKEAPSSELSNISNAVAEWADADSIAAHIAYGNDVFCTRDEAVSAGSASVFSVSNLAFLEHKYGLCIMKPCQVLP